MAAMSPTSGNFWHHNFYKDYEEIKKTLTTLEKFLKANETNRPAVTSRMEALATRALLKTDLRFLEKTGEFYHSFRRPIKAVYDEFTRVIQNLKENRSVNLPELVSKINQVQMLCLCLEATIYLLKEGARIQDSFYSTAHASSSSFRAPSSLLTSSEQVKFSKITTSFIDDVTNDENGLLTILSTSNSEKVGEYTEKELEKINKVVNSAQEFESFKEKLNKIMPEVFGSLNAIKTALNVTKEIKRSELIRILLDSCATISDKTWEFQYKDSD